MYIQNHYTSSQKLYKKRTKVLNFSQQSIFKKHNYFISFTYIQKLNRSAKKKKTEIEKVLMPLNKNEKSKITIKRQYSLKVKVTN